MDDLVLDSHEVMSEAALHHNPVHRPGQVDVRGEEDNVLALKRGDGLVNLHEMRHDLLQGALPFTRGPRAGAGVGPELARLLVVDLLRVEEGGATAGALVLAGEEDGGGHLLHGQIADVAAQLTAAGGAAGELGATVGAHQVTGMTLWNKGTINDQ